MDRAAMFSLTYGIFLAGVESEGRENACIINTAVQATSNPVCMHITMLKSNLTTEMILKKGSLAVSVLSAECPLSLIEGFGLKSGRESEKFEGVQHKADGNGNPYLEQYSIAYISMNITSTIDLGTHYLFIGDVVEAEKTGVGKPMTYTDYRILKSGGTLERGKTAPATKRWVCSVCHYVYDGEIPFEDLPDTWLCPVCKKPKSVFVLVEI